MKFLPTIKLVLILMKRMKGHSFLWLDLETFFLSLSISANMIQLECPLGSFLSPWQMLFFTVDSHLQKWGGLIDWLAFFMTTLFKGPEGQLGWQMSGELPKDSSKLEKKEHKKKGARISIWFLAFHLSISKELMVDLLTLNKINVWTL